jgi:signal transduction histidine kinase
MTLWPRTLFGRVALIVCGGLALAHLLTVWIIVRERGEQGLSMMLAYVGRDVGTSVAILDHLPPSERAAWLPRLARQNYGYTLGQPAAGAPAHGALARPLREVIAAELGASRVGTMQQDTGPATARATLLLPLRLADGTALSLRLAPPRPTVSATTLWLLGLQFSALALVAWLAVRLTVRPLARMADAANALQPGASGVSGSSGPALAEAGPHEVVQAARAFNAMQQRIGTQLAERMHLLAAISHDLQTPITRMRLRTDQLDDPALRHKLQADLAAMQALVEEGLAYARTAHAASEAPRDVDLHALLDTLVCDATDAGHQASLICPPLPPLHTRVQALQRIVGNLLSNATKFGGAAQLIVTAQAQALHIDVCDGGPGIPPDQLQAVLQPFYRLDSSRNRDSGGTGLGLAIAQQLSLAIGGHLQLSNRAEGGLQARLTLPWQAPTQGPTQAHAASGSPPMHGPRPPAGH